MNVKESNLLARADRMSESTLVNLKDWELAYLRVAMLRRVEETLSESFGDACDDTHSPRREAGVQPCPPGQGYAGAAAGVQPHVSKRCRVSHTSEDKR